MIRHVAMFEDGPAATLAPKLERLPVLLRVLVRDLQVKALDGIDDEIWPAEDCIVVYRLKGPPGTGFVDWNEGGGRMGCRAAMGHYKLLPLELAPSSEIARDSKRWREWTTEHKDRLMPDWMKR